MITILLLIAIVSLIVFALVKDVTRPIGFPPGPAWFPLVGCYPQVRRLLSQLGFYHLAWAALTEQFGPLVGLRLGRDRIVLVSGHRAVKHVLAREDCDGRPDGFFFRMRSFEKRLGVVFTDGPVWQQQRKFSTRHLRTLGLGGDAMERIVLVEVRALVTAITNRCENETQGHAVLTLHNACDVSVLNSLWAVVAGRRFDLEDVRLRRIFDLQHQSFRQLDMSGGLVNQMPFLRFLAPQRSGYNTLMSTIDANYAFLKETLAEHRSTFQRGVTRDLIDAYLEEMEIRKDEKDSTFNELQLLTLCLDLFMAGSETTSNTLGFLMQHVLYQPDVQRRAAEEIERVVGRDRLPTLADRQYLPYVEAVIMEVQRIMSVAPVAVPHRAVEDCDILGHRVPQDTILLLSVWSLHMDPEHWGDPEIFRPERFLDPSGETIIKDDWFIPFGNGKRRCLGEALARNNLFLFFAALLQNFSFSLEPGHEDEPPPLPYDGVTLSPRPFTGIVTIRKSEATN